MNFRVVNFPKFQWRNNVYCNLQRTQIVLFICISSNESKTLFKIRINELASVKKKKEKKKSVSAQRVIYFVREHSIRNELLGLRINVRCNQDFSLR